MQIHTPFRLVLLVSLVFGLLSGCRSNPTLGTPQSLATPNKAQQTATAEAIEPEDRSQPPLSDAALFIEGVTLRVSSVEQAQEYSAEGVAELRPDSPTDALLIVRAEIGSTKTEAAPTTILEGWKGQVFLLDKSGRRSEPKVEATSLDANGLVQDITWVFAVSHSAKVFRLQLPADQSVTLEIPFK